MEKFPVIAIRPVCGNTVYTTAEVVGRGHELRIATDILAEVGEGYEVFTFETTDDPKDLAYLADMRAEGANRHSLPSFIELLARFADVPRDQQVRIIREVCRFLSL